MDADDFAPGIDDGRAGVAADTICGIYDVQHGIQVELDGEIVLGAVVAFGKAVRRLGLVSGLLFKGTCEGCTPRNLPAILGVSLDGSVA